jgi:hypothetical protein
LHQEARKTYAEWIANASPDLKNKIRTLGLDKAPDDSSEVGGHSPYSISDIADSVLAKCEAAPFADSDDEIFADEFNVSLITAKKILKWHTLQLAISIEQEKASYLQIIVGGLLASKNPKLNAAGLAFAANLAALNGLPCQREYARQNHISVSAISKVVRAWSKALDLAPSAHQKTTKACEVYSAIGRSGHWRKKKVTAASASELLQRIKKHQTSQN